MPKLPENPDFTPKPNSSTNSTPPSSASPSSQIASAVGKAAGSGAAGEKAQKVAETVDKTVKTAKKVKKVGTVVSKTGGVAGKVIAFPGTWIAFVIVCVMIILYAAMQVIGKNENVEGCGGVGGTQAPVGELPIDPKTGLAEQENARNVLMTFLTNTPFKHNGNQPMSKEQAAGILGNWSQESTNTPWNTQGKWISFTATNAEVRSQGGNGGAKAIGVAQWDGVRRIGLLNYADKQGKPWQDLQTQLDWFKKELDGDDGDGYNAQMTKKAGFFEPGKTPSEYATAFEKGFERAGKPAMANRHKAADEAYAKWGGAAGTMGSGMGGCASSNFDNSSIVQMAISIALPSKAEANSHGTNGFNQAPQAYKDAKRLAEQIGGKDPQSNLFASCDRFVATVLRNTVDPKVPWGSTEVQTAYFKNSPKYRPIKKKSQLQPGDVLVTDKRGHIIIYIGMYKGKDSLAHASYMDRVGAITNNYLTEDLRDPRQYTAYRYSG